MALSEKQKNKARGWIRVTMVFVAVLLLFFSVVIPVINNAIALGIENDLKELPLPPNTALVESISTAGKLVGNGNGMQYFGAVLIKSELPADELLAYYADHDCSLSPQASSNVAIVDGELAYRHEEYNAGYYTVYRWGSAPDWLRDLLNTDIRGH